MVDLAAALTRQYRAALAMLRSCIEVCPEEIWLAGTHPRNTWRIAYHALFYADLYIQPGPDGFQPYGHTRDNAELLWENPPVVPAFTREELLEYTAYLDAKAADHINRLDLSSPESGFEWYPNFPKLDHVILNIRHIQTHVGQISEILIAHGIDSKWVGIPR